MQFVSFRGGSSFFCPGKVAGSLLVQIPLFCGGNYIILSGYPSWKLTWFFPISPYIFGAFEDVFSYFPRWGVCYTCTCSFLESHVWRSIGPKTRGPSEQMINCWGLLRCRGAKKNRHGGWKKWVCTCLYCNRKSSAARPLNVYPFSLKGKEVYIVWTLSLRTMWDFVGAIWFGVFVIPLRPSLTATHTVYIIYIYTTCKWHRIRWTIPQIALVLRRLKMILFLMIDHDRT